MGPRPAPFVPPLPLAHGELDAEDARELQELKAQIRIASGFLCEGYKEKCLRRRIAVRMRARGVHRYADYADLLGKDAEEYARLLAAVTINVSKFFRNSEVWDTLRAAVMPALFARPDPVVRIWSAGCAGGEEAYSLAMTVLEYAEKIGKPAAARRFRILGTDIDAQILDVARHGEYPELAFAETPPEARERWFCGSGLRSVRPEVRALVGFEKADLLRDAPAAAHHLILCRNVVIYFERSVQDALFTRFADALAPGGFLMLGKVETLLGPAAPRFRVIANAERLFSLT